MLFDMFVCQSMTPNHKTMQRDKALESQKENIYSKSTPLPRTLSFLSGFSGCAEGLAAGFGAGASSSEDA